MFKNSKFKKILSLILILPFAISLISCGKNNTKESNKTKSYSLSYEITQPTNTTNNETPFGASFENGNNIIEEGKTKTLEVIISQGYKADNLKVSIDGTELTATNMQVQNNGNYADVTNFSNEDNLKNRKIFYSISNITKNSKVIIDAKDCLLTKVNLINQLPTNANVKLYTEKSIPTEIQNNVSSTSLILTDDIFENTNYFTELTPTGNNFEVDYGTKVYLTLNPSNISNNSFYINETQKYLTPNSTFEYETLFFSELTKYNNTISPNNEPLNSQYYQPEQFILSNNNEINGDLYIEQLIPTTNTQTPGLYKTIDNVTYRIAPNSANYYIYIGEDRENSQFIANRNNPNLINKTDKIMFRLSPNGLITCSTEIIQDIYNNLTIKLNNSVITLSNENSIIDTVGEAGKKYIYFWLNYTDLEQYETTKDFETQGSTPLSTTTINCACGNANISFAIDFDNLENAYKFNIDYSSLTAEEKEMLISSLNFGTTYLTKIKETKTDSILTYYFLREGTPNNIDINFTIQQYITYTGISANIEGTATEINLTSNNLAHMKKIMFFDISIFNNPAYEQQTNEYSEISLLIPKFTNELNYTVYQNSTSNYYKVCTTYYYDYLIKIDDIFYLYRIDLMNMTNYWYEFTQTSINLLYAPITSEYESRTINLISHTPISNDETLKFTSFSFTKANSVVKTLTFNKALSQKTDAKFYILKDTTNSTALKDMILDSEELWTVVDSENPTPEENITLTSGTTIYFYSNISNALNGTTPSQYNYINFVIGTENEITNVVINSAPNDIRTEANNVSTSFGNISVKVGNETFYLYSATIEYADRYDVHVNNGTNDLYVGIVLN